MLPERDKHNLKKPYGLFFLWLILNSFLWLPFHVLVGYINLGIFGYQNSSSPVGFIAGIVGGLVFGLMQWLILSRHFAISPLWILSCVIGFTAYYMINWYSGAILMGVYQQYLIKQKLGDPILWFIAVFVGLGINRLLITMESLSYLSMSICLSFFVYGGAYALPPSILLYWYKYRLNAKSEFMIKPESL